MDTYEGSEPFVFISYAHKDKNKVLPIAEGLQKQGFRVWYDTEGISAGSEWPEVIAEHLEKCRCMVAFVSRSFGESVNCREELNFAKELKKTILVVYLEDRQNLRASVRMRLGTLHALNLADYRNNHAFLNAISEEEALLPCLGAAATASTPAPVPAEPVEPSPKELYHQARELTRKKEHEKAFLLYKKAAEQGHANAQYYLGFHYLSGIGVQQDKAEAWMWFQKAADQGDKDAIAALHVL